MKSNMNGKLILVCLAALLSLSFVFGSNVANYPVNSINMNGQDGDSLKTLAVPATSGSTVTEKWTHDFMATTAYYSVDISEDGNYIAVSNKSSVNLYQKDSNSPIWTYNSPNSNNYEDVGISKNGSYIVAVEDEEVILLNKDPETPKTTVWNYTVGGGFCADIAAKGKYIAIANTTGSVMLLNNAPENPKSYIWKCNVSGSINDIAISGDGNYTIAGNADGNIYLFNKTITPTKTPEWSYDTTASVTYVAISENGQYFLAANGDNEVYLFNTTNPQGYMWNYTCTAGVNDMAISDDGTYVAICNGTRIEYLNNIYSSSKQPMWSFDFGTFQAAAVDISADGKYVVVAVDEDSLYLFNNKVTSPKNYEWVGYHDPGGLAEHDIAISDDGRYFVAIDVDGFLRLLHHNIPIPGGGGYIPPGGDDDDEDDDDDTGVVVVVVVIIIIASVGGGVVVIIILIKKGIIGASRG